MINEKSESKRTLVSIDTWRDDPSKVRIFIEDRDTIIIPKDYLYEMKRCIDTVLGDEKDDCVICEPELTVPLGKTIPMCEKNESEILGQPLTEGEGECEKPECRARKAIFTKENPAMEEVIQNTKWKDYLKPQQESNKEECKNESGLCIPEDGLHFMECPSHYKNKEMPRCGGLGCKFPHQHPGACYQGERKEPSKKPSMTIGCMECGNNIRI